MKKNREIFNKSNTNLLVISTIAGVAFIASVTPLVTLSLTLPTIISLCIVALLSAVVGIFSMYYATIVFPKVNDKGIIRYLGYNGV